MSVSEYDQEGACATPTLRVVTTVLGRTAHVLMAGVLDLSTSGVVVSAVETVLEDRAVAMIRLDAALVDFCESSGISALLRTRRLAAVRGVRLYVAGARPSLQRVLAMTNSGDLMEQPPGRCVCAVKRLSRGQRRLRLRAWLVRRAVK